MKDIPYTLGEIKRKLCSFIPEKSDQELYNIGGKGGETDSETPPPPMNSLT